MYLPLAAVISGLVVGGFLAGHGLSRRKITSPTAVQVLGGSLAIFAALVLGMFTFQRNFDYESDLSIWQDTVNKAPDNARAQSNLGFALWKYERFAEAAAHCRKALELRPDFVQARLNLGLALGGLGQSADAMASYQMALKVKPDDEKAYNNLGVALASMGEGTKPLLCTKRRWKSTPTTRRRTATSVRS